MRRLREGIPALSGRGGSQPAVSSLVCQPLRPCGQHRGQPPGRLVHLRAAKAAQNQLLKTVALEWRRTMPGVCVASLHPGTTDTPLSKPFQGRVPAGKLLKPDFSAAALLGVLLTLCCTGTGLHLWPTGGIEESITATAG